MPARDDEPMMDPHQDRAWLVAEFPGSRNVFPRSVALAVWWGFLWQRRNRESA